MPGWWWFDLKLFFLFNSSLYFGAVCGCIANHSLCVALCVRTCVNPHHTQHKRCMHKCEQLIEIPVGTQSECVVVAADIGSVTPYYVLTLCIHIIYNALNRWKLITSDTHFFLCPHSTLTVSHTYAAYTEGIRSLETHRDESPPSISVNYILQRKSLNLPYWLFQSNHIPN